MLMKIASLVSELTPLQTRVVREIVALVRREGRRAGEHLPEIQLATQIGTSRSPVQAALRHLSSLGVVQQDVNRGFFIAKDAKDWAPIAAKFSSLPDDPLYLAIAEERQSGRLPDEVSEAELMRRFKVARSTLRKVLSRIGEEGWIVPCIGNGWAFQNMMESPEAYEESYFFRQTIEPSGILSPSFNLVRHEMEQLRREQQQIVDGGFKTMTPIELFEANSRFHETLANWSGNRFILQSVKRVNQLRRLIEYRQASQREPRQTQAQEHLAILDALANLDHTQAAYLLRGHLDGARRAKVRGKGVF